jgi:hypothetical protein
VRHTGSDGFTSVVCPHYQMGREEWLLLRRTGKAATKPPGFAPGLTNHSAETGESGGHLNDDECDHFYWPALASKRPI